MSTRFTSELLEQPKPKTQILNRSWRHVAISCGSVLQPGREVVVVLVLDPETGFNAYISEPDSKVEQPWFTSYALGAEWFGAQPLESLLFDIVRHRQGADPITEWLLAPIRQLIKYGDLASFYDAFTQEP